MKSRMTLRLGVMGLLAATLLIPPASGTALAAPDGDAPQISRSRGVDGGIVVLWPRIIPGIETAASRVLAHRIQEQLASLAREAFPGRPVDVRPEPERVCPRSGCRGISVGALLLREDDGCAVLALISGPGQSDQQLVPWTGHVRLRSSVVPFREPPESWVTITDFGMCNTVGSDLEAGDASVVRAIREVGLMAEARP